MGEPREPEAPESGGEKVESRNSQRREYRHGFLAVDLPSYLLPSTRSTFYFLLSTFYFLLSTFYFLLSTFYFLLSTFYFLPTLSAVLAAFPLRLHPLWLRRIVGITSLTDAAMPSTGDKMTLPKLDKAALP